MTDERHLQGVKFEPNSFKLTHEMVVLMGGRNSQGYQMFQQLTVKAFLAIRPHADQIVSTVQMMLETQLPSFKGEPTIKRLRDRFALGLTERQAAEWMMAIVRNAHENVRSTAYDEFQRVSHLPLLVVVLMLIILSKLQNGMFCCFIRYDMYRCPRRNTVQVGPAEYRTGLYDTLIEYTAMDCGDCSGDDTLVAAMDIHVTVSRGNSVGARHNGKLYRLLTSGCLACASPLVLFRPNHHHTHPPSHPELFRSRTNRRECLQTRVTIMEIEIADIARDATVWDVKRKIGSILHSDYFYNATDPKDRPAYVISSYHCTADRNRLPLL